MCCNCNCNCNCNVCIPTLDFNLTFFAPAIRPELRYPLTGGLPTASGHGNGHLAPMINKPALDSSRLQFSGRFPFQTTMSSVDFPSEEPRLGMVASLSTFLPKESCRAPGRLVLYLDELQCNHCDITGMIGRVIVVSAVSGMGCCCFFLVAFSKGGQYAS